MSAAKARFQCALTQRPDKIAWTTNNPARTRITLVEDLEVLEIGECDIEQDCSSNHQQTWDSDAENAIRSLLRRGPLNEPGA